MSEYVHIGVNNAIEDAPTLNCDHASLTALLQFYGLPDPSTPIGSQWHFRLKRPHQLPGTMRVPVLRSIARETGFGFTQRQLEFPRFYDDVLNLVRRGVPVIVYGNQFNMPWVPYFQNEPASHPFIIDGIDGTDQVHVLEAYLNNSDWGPCNPSEQWISRALLSKAVETLDGPLRGRIMHFRKRVEADPVELATQLTDNAAAIEEALDQRDEFRRFSRRGRRQATDVESMKVFDLACWEMTRSRACHLRWLRRNVGRPGALHADAVERFATEIADPWQRVSQFAHIGFKRVEMGARPPAVSFDLIANDLAEAELAFAREILADADGDRKPGTRDA